MGTVKLTLNEQKAHKDEQKAHKEERAVVYARYSSHSQGEQSIEGQLAAAKKYAADHNYSQVYPLGSSNGFKRDTVMQAY